ncbi:response regulator transcription factor [Streptomyces sp. NPDC049813]|uniref:response regulator transcription factor n=1 Tax=Streptomyces sp. NPDC049813 TaxID=3365597 RepID=UPI0037A8BF63
MTAATEQGTPRPPLSVLLCDDNRLLLETLTEVLEAQPDFQVVGTACEGDEALRLAGRHRPDLVVLDVRFPGGGHTVARNVGRCSPHSVIVAFSAYNDKASMEHMRSAGARAYVLKGVRNRELLTTLRGVARPR